MLAGDEDDDLEVTMDVIDNLEQVSEIIIVIGQVDAPDSASEESRPREPWDDKDRFRDSDVVGFDEIDERDDSDEMEELDLRQEEERDAPEEQESDVSIHDDGMIDEQGIDEKDD